MKGWDTGTQGTVFTCVDSQNSQIRLPLVEPKHSGHDRNRDSGADPFLACDLM